MWYCNYTYHLKSAKNALDSFELGLHLKNEVIVELDLHLQKAAREKRWLIVQPKRKALDDLVTRSIWLNAYQEASLEKMEKVYKEHRNYLSINHPMRKQFTTYMHFDSMLNKEVYLAWSERSHHLSKHLALLADLRTRIDYPALDSAVLLVQKLSNQPGISKEEWGILNRNGVSSIPKKMILE